jgi:hypothetical protein
MDTFLQGFPQTSEVRPPVSPQAFGKSQYTDSQFSIGQETL